MPSPVSFADFKRMFTKHGISIEPSGRGSHFKMEKIIGGVRIVFPFPVHNNQVDYVYVRKACRRFQIKESDLKE